jgi:hypothetical protein
MAIVAVIITGRKRCVAPRTTALRSDMPDSRNVRMYDTSTTPLSTAMPHSAIKPTDAGTDRYSPVTNSPMMPPIDANGSTVMISVASAAS